MRKNYSKKYVLLCAFLMMSVIAFAQTGGIKGKVIDETNLALPGASVSIVGTTLGATTDANGNYTITGLKPGNYTITANFLGYIAIQKTVTVGSNSAVTIDFTLKPANTSLNEVVVIGYGSRTKKELTGAITTVTAKDFQTGTITSPDQLIQGKVAGVSITSNGGQPGGGSVIRVRQGASLNASNEPLIVIDGIPLQPERNTDGTSTIAGAADPLSLINPQDIESFTVLKDAASTAIYGSRASNGVILITTKKGVKGKPVFNFNTEESVASVANQVNVLSAAQVRAYVNTNGTPAQIAELGSANTNWQNQIYQKALTFNNNLSVTGSVKNMPYRLSVNYLDQDGTLRTDNIKRTTAAIRLSPSFFKDQLKLNFNLNGTDQKSRFANQGAIGSATTFDPTQPVYDAASIYNGYYEHINAGTTTLNSVAGRNPLALLNDDHNVGDTYRSFGNFTADYNFSFLPGLHANLNLGYDVSKGEGRNFVPATAAQSFNSLGNNTPYRQKILNTVGEFYLAYNKDIKSIKSTVNATAGYGFYDYSTTNYNFQGLSANGSPQPGTSAPTYPYGKDQHALLSYYGRLIYTFNEKYIFAGSIRDDESSRFSSSNRHAVFPSAAFTWRIKDEDFLKSSTTLSDLKLRLSYGVTGQQEGLSNYGFLPTYYISGNSSKYQLGNNYYNMYTPNAYDTSLKWEQTNSTNGGIDFGFMDQRIYGSIDVYYKKTKDLLATVPIPAGTNFTNQLTTNVGNTNTTGAEFSITAVPVKTKDLTWTLNYNVAYNNTKITNLYLAPNPSNPGTLVGGISGGIGNYIQINSVNNTPYSFYVYKQVYGANGKPMEGVYADLNGDGSITASDLYRYKSATPKFIMGFSTQVNYKKWTLSTVLRANLGNYVYNNVNATSGVQSSILNPGGFIGNTTTDIFNTNFKQNQYFSDYYVENASFLRMDNAGLSYNFGKVFSDNRLNLQVGANCQNVFVITKYKGVDPEVFSGIDNNFYPRSRVYTVSLNLGF